MSNTSLDATAAAEYFFAGAVARGLRHVCISPGSRSTPLAVAAARTAGLTTSVHLDERVAGFVALGRAVRSGDPVALICTSGTAGANYLPAIAEASLSHLPLVAITADRPPEHQGWGVGQTYEQVGLYHRQVRSEFSMPVGGDGGPEFSQRAGWRAMAAAIEHHGPVHVNWPFRLPLEPRDGALDLSALLSERPVGVERLDLWEVEQLCALLDRSERPVLIAGPGALRPPDLDTSSVEGLPRLFEQRALRLGEATATARLPVLADALSGLRHHDQPGLVPSPALTVHRAEAANPPLSPDLIIHLGQTPTAKATRLWWERQDATHVLLDPRDEWNDPSHVFDHRFTSDPIRLLKDATATSSSRTDEWMQRWLDEGAYTRQVRDDVLDSWDQVTEAQVANLVGSFATSDDQLVASSSMPVRDIDTFTSIECPAPIHANRGINGIDGVVATAAGMAAQARASRPGSSGQTIVLIGDVALLHDIGGVLDAARQGVELIIVVPNNNGGGIFSVLPAKDALDSATFEQLFTTPHGTRFEFLGGYDGIEYDHTTDLGRSLDQARSNNANPVRIIEVTVEVEPKLALQTAILDRLAT